MVLIPLRMFACRFGAGFVSSDLNTPTKSNLYFDCPFETVFSELAL
jgi:hypothetical protein